MHTLVWGGYLGDSVCVQGELSECAGVYMQEGRNTQKEAPSDRQDSARWKWTINSSSAQPRARLSCSWREFASGGVGVRGMMFLVK